MHRLATHGPVNCPLFTFFSQLAIETHQVLDAAMRVLESTASAALHHNSAKINAV
jgi:hypothetical protein